MDGENNDSKPYEQMDDLGGFPIFFGLTVDTHMVSWLPLSYGADSGPNWRTFPMVLPFLRDFQIGLTNGFYWGMYFGEVFFQQKM